LFFDVENLPKGLYFLELEGAGLNRRVYGCMKH